MIHIMARATPTIDTKVLGAPNINMTSVDQVIRYATKQMFVLKCEMNSV